MDFLEGPHMAEAMDGAPCSDERTLYGGSEHVNQRREFGRRYAKQLEGGVK